MTITPNTVRITFSDGTESIQPYQSQRITFPALGTVLFTADEDGSVTPSLIPQTDICPQTLHIEFSLDDCSENTWFYDSNTNS